MLTRTRTHTHTHTHTRSRTHMYAESIESADAVRRLLAHDTQACQALAADLARNRPRALLTVARGTSDNAAHYMAYLIMARLGLPVTSLPMSLITLYQSRLSTDGLVSLAFSQSGQSPDLTGPTATFRSGGARTVAFVNDTDSPLARAAEWVFGLHAGPEKSVAATKSCIAELAAGARFVAHWQQALETGKDNHGGQGGADDLGPALPDLPASLAEAAQADWSPAVEALRGASRLYVVGRGTGLPIAHEAALKLKETCGLQAEAFSSAEVRHGPMALVEPGYPMLIFAPRGPAQPDLLALADDMRRRGARVLLAAPAGTPGAELPLVPAPHADLDPITVIQSHYVMAEALSRARGMDPDQPPHLSKVTCTR